MLAIRHLRAMTGTLSGLEDVIGPLCCSFSDEIDFLKMKACFLQKIRRPVPKSWFSVAHAALTLPQMSQKLLEKPINSEYLNICSNAMFCGRTHTRTNVDTHC